MSRSSSWNNWLLITSDLASARINIERAPQARLTFLKSWLLSLHVDFFSVSDYSTFHSWTFFSVRTHPSRLTTHCKCILQLPHALSTVRCLHSFHCLSAFGRRRVFCCRVVPDVFNLPGHHEPTVGFSFNWCASPSPIRPDCILRKPRFLAVFCFPQLSFLLQILRISSTFL